MRIVLLEYSWKNRGLSVIKLRAPVKFIFHDEWRYDLRALTEESEKDVKRAQPPGAVSFQPTLAEA